MSKVFTHAVRNAFYSIPIEVLNMAFPPAYDGDVSNIQTRMINNVIKARVLLDCDLIGGVTRDILITSDYIVETGDNWVKVVVPKNLTEGKSIVSVYTAIDAPGFINTPPAPLLTNVSELKISARKLLDSVSNSGVLVTANIEIIGENSLKIIGINTFNRNMVLRVLLENDVHMTNIAPASARAFSTLVTYAIEAEVYNKCIIRTDIGSLYHGGQLSSVQNFITKFETSNEKYLTELNTNWKAVAFMNDNTAMDGFISSLYIPI